MRFEAILKPHGFTPQTATTKWTKVPETEHMQAQLEVLEEQYKGLQSLVGELLLTNQKLREEVAALRRKAEPTAPATHPQPRQDR